MTMKKEIFSELVLAEKELINKCLHDRSVKSRLEEFGYSDEVLDEGKVLLEKVVILIGELQDEYGEGYEETKEIHKEIQSLNIMFRKSRNIVRIALKNRPALMNYLGLNDEVSNNINVWVRQAMVFYSSLLADYEVVKELRRFQLTEDKLEAQMAIVSRIEEMKKDYDKDIVENKQRAQLRDEMIEELKDWTEELKGIARIAFEHEPETLKKLGVKYQI
jgi:molybdopterin converting factor small subunit